MIVFCYLPQNKINPMCPELCCAFKTFWRVAKVAKWNAWGIHDS